MDTNSPQYRGRPGKDRAGFTCPPIGDRIHTMLPTHFHSVFPRWRTRLIITLEEKSIFKNYRGREISILEDASVSAV